jgi:ADP-heptose:LPS heptosyltransferase
MVKKILFITLSNFGDVILSLPVLDALRAEYSDARITVMVGPRAAEVFKGNPHIHNLIIYDKYAPLREKINMFFKLRQECFDIVIDLRNTFFGALLPARFKTSPFLYIPSSIRHMKERNLYILSKALRHKGSWRATKEKLFYIDKKEKDYINNLLQKNGITDKDKFIIVSPAAGGTTRRWDKENFIKVCKRLARDYAVILIGRGNDRALTGYIRSNCEGSVRNTKTLGQENKISNGAGKIFDFAGLTNLAQLACLLRKACAAIVCDTGSLQLASYLDVPIVALFGPSDEQRYGPWPNRFKVITAKIPCRPCRKPNCEFNTIECMRKISPSEVLDSIDALLKS